MQSLARARDRRRQRRRDLPRRRLPRALRIASAALGIAGFVVLLCCGLVAGVIWFTLPSEDDTARIPGLSAPVDVAFDRYGVPHIRAANERDGAAALGWVHARDRMFQMELMRRAASGRLSELFGAATVPIDREMRTLGLRRRAEADLAGLPPDVRAMLDAYAAGVNARIAQEGRLIAPEFVVFGAPEPWTALDCLLWGKTMSLYLAGNWRTELARLSLQGRLPPDKIAQLWPPVDAKPADAAAADVRYADAARALLDVVPAFPAAFTQPDHASNEWAVDGAHSVSGAPLLAGDPHLGFALPSVWYLARIETPEGVLAGATAPGVPFMVVGHNSRIAWTFTTTGADTQDLFIETPAGPNEYQTPDGPLPFVVRQERIGVRGGHDQTITVRETRHGPVISDLRPVEGGPILALAAAELAPDDTAAIGLYALNRAQTATEAMAAAPRITSPVQNLLIADRAHIGLAVTGRVPVRKSGDGSFPAPGADGSHDWTGWADGDALPHFYDPPSGRLVNANEPLGPGGGTAFLGRDAFGDWRARRIRALLETKARLAASDFAAMQTDVGSTYADQLLPVLLAAKPATPLGRAAQGLLEGWGGRMTMGQPQPLLFNAVLDAFLRGLVQSGALPAGAPIPLLDFTAFVLSPAGAGWCGGDCGPALAAAFDRAAASLAQRWGDDPSAWRWGPAHLATFAHPLLSHIPLVGVLGTVRIASPGDDSTLDRGTPGPDGTSIHGASFRGVYDLADLDASLFTVAPGQSGNVFRAHARDMLTSWRDGAVIRLGPMPGRGKETARLLP